jgi:hypothetical protein
VTTYTKPGGFRPSSFDPKRQPAAPRHYADDPFGWGRVVEETMCETRKVAREARRRAPTLGDLDARV